MGENSKLIGVVLSLACMGLLGLLPIIADGRPEPLTALGFAVLLSIWQTLFATPLVLREAIAKRRSSAPAASAPRSRRRMLIVVLGTSAMYATATYIYVLSVEKVGPITAALALQAYPLFPIILESVFLKRRKTPLELGLTAMLVGALYHIATDGTWRFDGLSPWFALALLTPVLWSIAHVIMGEELKRSPITPPQVVFVRVGLSAVFLGLALVATEPWGALAALWRPDLQLAAAAMGLVYYVELVLWFHAIRRIDVSVASAIIAPWPAGTMAIAAIFLGAMIETHQIAAFLVIVACIYGLIVADLRKTRAPARAAQVDGAV